MSFPPSFSPRLLRAVAILLPALFYAGLATLVRAQTPAPEPQKTIVAADRLEAKNSGIEGQYVFIGHVHITGTNLEITCDRLEIYSVATPEENAGTTMHENGNIRRMLATGSVTIAQEGRHATCNVAEVLPLEDRIILTENPVLTDISTGVTTKGERMIYNRGERLVVIEHPEVVGPALPNLGLAPGDAAAGSAAPGPAKPAPTAPTEP